MYFVKAPTGLIAILSLRWQDATFGPPQIPKFWFGVKPPMLSGLLSPLAFRLHSQDTQGLSAGRAAALGKVTESIGLLYCTHLKHFKKKKKDV